MWRLLVRVEGVAVAALLLAACLVGLWLAADAHVRPNGLFGPGGAWRAGASATLAFGAIPALAVAAPIYAWLLHRRWASWPRVVALGIWPAAPLLAWSPQVAMTGLACGMFVACATHGWMSRQSSGR
ncbi:hypothetical protein [Coralloluteibacterium stylophorae]|uniref:Uncharacterized protein n=1 Tax=Coralloluteibacterium stylophorae TaxID=1776034 RepID=A0A8J7VU84_9GAMM|nr:hypothetical protein [Coralloluteibacterium stylophorae]MBS7458670.1 hypothetical protein [Coralloluteibacterium stylophorae]